MLKVVATRKVNYLGIWYDAGDNFICSKDDFDGLKAAGVEKYKEKKLEKSDKSIKDIKTR